MSTNPVPSETVNPLSLKPETYDILNMLRSMDRHLEAKEFEKKFDHDADPLAKVEPGIVLKQKVAVAIAAPQVPRIKALKTQLLKGRKIIRRIMGAKRFKFSAKVLLHKNDRYIKGKILDISKSGLFVSADMHVFKENEVVRLYIRPKGMKKSYKAIATVMRFNTDARYPRGYGLKFVLPTS